MRKRLTTAIVFVLSLGLVMAAPQFRGGKGHGFGDGKGHEFGERHLGAMTRFLDLTEEQQAEVKKIVDAEREVMKPVVEQLTENRAALREASKGGAFNEAEITALAERQGDLMAQMIVSRERVQYQIWQILTPEQREKAEEFRGKMSQRMERGGRGPRGGN